MSLFLKSILAGVMTTVSGTVFLSIPDPIVGSFMFSLGLFTILIFDFKLYTSEVGKIIDNLSYLKTVLLILAGNLIGTALSAEALLLTRFNDLFFTRSTEIIAVKLADNYLSIFILSTFCGLLISIASNSYRHNDHELGKYIAIFMCIMAFILSGYEHSIANFVYLSYSQVLTNIETWIFTAVVVLGNATGTLIIPFIKKLPN